MSRVDRSVQKCYRFRTTLEQYETHVFENTCTWQAKTAIAEFAYCDIKYQDALKTLERSSFRPLNMHNSENVIAYSVTIPALVGVFRSLKHDQDFSCAALLGQAVQKLPPNMKDD